MPKYTPYDLNQDSMVVINLSEQLQAGTFEHAIAFLVEKKLDLSVFAEKIKNDDGGRSAYDPAIMLKIILFVYSEGIACAKNRHSSY